MAQNFAKKVLIGHTDELVIKRDATLLADLFKSWQGKDGVAAVAKHLVQVAGDARKQGRGDDSAQFEKLMDILLEQNPEVWSSIVPYHEECRSIEKIVAIFKLAVEAHPNDPRIWRYWAEFEQRRGHVERALELFVRSVMLDSDNLQFALRIAGELSRVFSQNKDIFPPHKRHIYITNVQEILVRFEGQLDSVGYSKLAWLFFNAGNEFKAREYAEKGLDKNSRCEYCLKLINRIAR